MAPLKTSYQCILLCWLLSFSVNSWSQTVAMVSTQWEPFLSSALTSGGVITDIASAAFKKEGHETSIDWYPWVRAVKMAKEGEVDLLMGAYYTEERAKSFYYSKPIFDIDIGLIALARLNITEYKDLESLKPYNIGVLRGWAYPRAFERAEFLEKSLIVDQVSAARMLLADRIDMVAASIPVFQHELKILKGNVDTNNGKGTPNTVVLKPLLGTEKIYLAFGRTSKNSEKLLADFNRGLAKIRADGTFNKILAKHGF